MKKSLLIVLVFLYTNVFAVEGYKDIYIKGDKDIYIHTIYCGEDLSNLGGLRPSVIFTNTENIQKGTYSFNSAYGKFSTTFKPIKGQHASIQTRGTLSKGQTKKSQMKIDICLVDKHPQLPNTLNKRIKKDILKSNDPSWNKKMKDFTTYFGKPASSKGKYLSQK